MTILLKILRKLFPFLHADFRAPISVSHQAAPILLGGNRKAYQTMAFPFQGNLSTAYDTEATDGTVCPLLRKGGQQDDTFFIALHQHVGNCRRGTEIAVNLEGRMVVEEVG